MPVAVTGLYASLLMIIAFVLVVRVGARRGKVGVSIGDGGDKTLFLENRRHLNFLEHVPMALLLLAIIELNGAPKLWIHWLGGALVIARICHPIGLHADNARHPMRGIGAGITMLVTLIAIGIALWQGIRALS